MLRRIDEYQHLNNELRRVGTPRPKNMPAELTRLEIEMENPSGGTNPDGVEGRVALPPRADAIFKQVVFELDTARATIAEMRKTAPDNSPYFFGPSKAAAQSAPAYLRTSKPNLPLRNHRTPRAELLATVAQIWREKRVSDELAKESGEPAVLLPGVFVAHLQAKVDEVDGGGQDLLAELAVNVLDGCKRYGDDADAALFGGIMQGVLSEDVQAAQMGYLLALRAKLAAMAWTETPKGPKAKKGSPSKP